MPKTMQGALHTGQVGALQGRTEDIKDCRVRFFLALPLFPVSKRRDIPQHIANAVEWIGTWFINVTKHRSAAWCEAILVQSLYRTYRIHLFFKGKVSVQDVKHEIGT